MSRVGFASWIKLFNAGKMNFGSKFNQNHTYFLTLSLPFCSLPVRLVLIVVEEMQKGQAKSHLASCTDPSPGLYRGPPQKGLRLGRQAQANYISTG